MKYLLVMVALLGQAAPPGEDARGGQRALEGYAWPRGMNFSIADGTTALPAVIDAPAQTRGKADAAPGVAGAAKAPRAGGPPGTTAAGAGVAIAPAEQARRAGMQQRAAELSREAVEVRAAGIDVAKLAHAKEVAALRPVLLFLVEHGVMTGAEADAALEELDLDELTARIAEKAQKLEEERDRQRVMLFLEENSDRSANRRTTR